VMNDKGRAAFTLSFAFILFILSIPVNSFLA